MKDFIVDPYKFMSGMERTEYYFKKGWFSGTIPTEKPYDITGLAPERYISQDLFQPELFPYAVSFQKVKHN